METPVSGYDPASTSVGQRAVIGESGRAPVLGADLSFYSRDVWRGLALNQYSVFQPKVWASKWGFTSFVWATMNLGAEPYRGKFSEVDINLSYERSFAGFTVKPGFIYYTYPYVDMPSSGEAYLALAYKWGGFEISTTNYFDVRELRGGYYGSVSVAYSYPFKDIFLFQIAATEGFANAKWNDYYVGVDVAAANNATIDVSLNVSPLDWVYIRPSLQMNFLTDSDLRDSPFVEDPNLFVLGLSMGVTY